MFYKRQNKVKPLQDCLVCIFFSYLDDVKLFFSVSRYVNYLIGISVDNTIEANYRIILYTLLQKNFLFAVFVFDINRKTANDSFFLKKTLSAVLLSWKERSLNLFPFLSKRSHGDEVESLTLKNQSLLMTLKLSLLNNSYVKNRTRNKVVHIVSPKSSSSRPLRVFSIIFPFIRKSNKVWWRSLLAVHQSVNQSRVYIKNGSLLRKSKQERTK